MDLIRTLVRSVNQDYQEPHHLHKDRVLLQGDVECYLHLKRGRVYLLRGEVNILPGSKLKIDAGVVVEAEESSLLRVHAGATIHALGTEDSPIVFTSSCFGGLWGGITIEGYTSTTTVDGLVQIADSRCDLKSSGTLKFLRIEYAPLLLLSISRETCIEDVQVSMSPDDSFVFSGGDVNARRLVSYKPRMHGFRLKGGYSGGLQQIFNLHSFDANVGATGILFQQQEFEPDSVTIPAPILGTYEIPTRAVVSQATLIGPLETNEKYDGEQILSDIPESFGVVFQDVDVGGLHNSIISGYKVGILAGDLIDPTPPGVQNLRAIANIVGAIQPIIFTGDPYVLNLRRELLLTLNALLFDARLFTLYCEESYVPHRKGIFTSVYSYNTTGLADNTYFELIKFRGAFNISYDWSKTWAKYDLCPVV